MNTIKCNLCNDSGRFNTGLPPYPYWIECKCKNPKNKKMIRTILEMFFGQPIENIDTIKWFN